MTLDDILANVADQEKGRWFDLVDPFSGALTGIRMSVVGPDSDTAQRARIKLADELTDLADDDGRVSPANREKARLNALAAHVIRWEITEDGQPVPFSTKNVRRLLRVLWVEQQVDSWASDRRYFRSEPA